MCGSCCNGISHTKGTFLYEHCRNRTFSFIQLCLDHKSSCHTVRICFELHHFCCQKNHLEKLLNSFFCMRGYRYENRASAPVFRNQFILCQFLFYTLNICTWLIDLIDRYDNFNSRCFGMVDRLDRLRHHTVICCNYKNRNICRICSSHTHCSKRLMSRCIQECDLFSVDLYYRSTDVLCDSTCLAVCHTGITDRIQQRSLSMVNVSHNTYNRRTFYHSSFIFFIFFEKLFNDIYNFFFFTKDLKFHCDFFCCLKINFLIHCYDLALHEQFLYDHRRYHFHLVCQFLNCQYFRDCDLFDFLFLFHFRLWLWSLHFYCRLLLSAFFALAFKSFFSVFFFLVIFFFIFCFIALRFLLLYQWRRN